MITLEEAQLKYDELTKEIKSLQNKQKEYVSKVELDGIFLNSENKKFEKDEKVMGIFWDIDYNTRYVGEKGMYTTLFSGASQLTEQEVLDLRFIFDAIITKKDANDLDLDVELPFKSDLVVDELVYIFECAEEYQEDSISYKNLFKHVMQSVIGCDEYFLYDSFLNDKDFKQDESNLKWKQQEEGYDEGTLNKDSFIKIKETTISDINKTKTVYEKEVSP